MCLRPLRTVRRYPGGDEQAWKLLAQLESGVCLPGPGPGSAGARGRGFVFVNQQGDQGAFVWQHAA